VRILGIDPGSTCTGYGVVEGGGQKPSMMTSGVIRPGRGPLSQRLARLFDSLEKLIDANQPEEIAVEEVFTGVNAHSALVLGHARGVILLAAGRANLPVHEYPSRRVKQAITGYGAAEKVQVQSVLRGIFGELPRELDASDALAVALCHWYESTAQVRVVVQKGHDDSTARRNCV
jgi:crossover junction endodeoxyribonuclease RuvC